MGGRESRPGFLSYEEALRRLSDAEVRRLREAFKRAAGNVSGASGAALSAATFGNEVLSGAPPPLADRLFVACGGSRRGLQFRELVCALVLLTKGSQEEKIRFLWTLYCNDAGTYILKSDFVEALTIEKSSLISIKSHRNDINLHILVTTLFGGQGDKINFDTFRSWLLMRKNATVFSNWLLVEPTVNLTSDLETPTFYQSLAGVTHLEERDICLLEKYFWKLLQSSPSGQLDAECLGPLLSPPIPRAALQGLLLALDENRDNHVDFKELCCGLSAACRGPISERVKFCFKIFDADRDGILNRNEVVHMINILCFVANESLHIQDNTVSKEQYSLESNGAFKFEDVFDSLKSMLTMESNIASVKKRSKEMLFPNNDCSQADESSLESNELSDQSNNNLESRMCVDQIDFNSLSDSSDGEYWGLSQENFLIWHVDKGKSLIAPFLQLIYQVCHIVLGLRPQCKHQEQEIVLGWLHREVRRGYSVGQFWYLISSDWWSTWLTYTGSNGNSSDKVDSCYVCGRSGIRNHVNPNVDEAIVCDENFNNSSEYMGDLLNRAETGSLGSGSSSSGISSNSSSQCARPGPINNSNLLAPNPYNVRTLTGEGGHLKKDLTLSQHRDFELVPDSLWKALAQWYGGPQPLPRQVIQPPKSGVELELYPRNLRLMKHIITPQHHAPNTSSWSGMVGGYGAAALSTVGAASYQPSPPTAPLRHLAYTAAFSRLASVKQVCDFICNQLGLFREEVRLWLIDENLNSTSEDGSLLSLLEEEAITLSQLGVVDGQRLLIEVRNKDLTWPEEMGALSKSALSTGGKRAPLNNATPGTIPHPPGATGLQNLGNTCFMNAALQAVWNTGPLTRYFTRGMHIYELNMSNPLGTRGALAQRYGELCKEVWSGGVRSVAPLRVRWCIWQNADRFSGGGQHDSQELLAWLLDALHEDLNRVDTRVYTELRDSDGRPDQIVAQEAWEQHTIRNQSIITELFYGQLKSKVTCSNCKHESVRFDPFNMLSLPLPMESYVLVEVLVILLDGSVPIKYGIRLNSEGRYCDLQEALSKLCGIDAKQLLLAEINGPIPTRFPHLKNRIRLNSSTVNLFAYQLPSVFSYTCLSVYTKDVKSGGVETESTNYAERLSSSSECSNSPVSDNYLMNKNSPKTNHIETSDDFPNKEVNNVSGEITNSTEKQSFNNSVKSNMKFNIKNSPTLSLKLNSSNNSSPTKIVNDNQETENKTDDDQKSSHVIGACFLIAIHRKQTRQDTYFLSQHKNKSELFGLPLLIPISEGSSSKHFYTTVWTQVTRLLSVPPKTPPDQSNHATDCDDSLGYTFPFTLRIVSNGGIRCAICPWTRFCRGCIIPCSDDPFILNLNFNMDPSSRRRNTEVSQQINLSNNSPNSSPRLRKKSGPIPSDDSDSVFDSQVKCLDFKDLKINLKQSPEMEYNPLKDIYIAIDWDPTALHLRYQSTREKLWKEHPSVNESRMAHAAAVQLEHCLNAFTSEEQLEQRYSCASCRTSQPATKKLQIWRLPPILIIHLKRFQYVNNKWIKSQKVVDFPYKNFDPTAFLASIPQETILRHTELKHLKLKHVLNTVDSSDDETFDDPDETLIGNCSNSEETSQGMNSDLNKSNDTIDTVVENLEGNFNNSKGTAGNSGMTKRKSSILVSNRERLESTSLLKTPVLDDNFVDFHQHKLKAGEDPFDLKYSLYAVVSHSGMMNGGHYVSYAQNPSGAWYYYNDSSCKELTPAAKSNEPCVSVNPSIDPSSAYMLFYERTGLDYEPYLPDVSNRKPVISETELADGEDSDFKKMCTIS